MSKILSISERASLAMHAMVLLAANDPRPVTTRQAAEKLDASEAHLSKIFQQLVRAEYVASTRGPGGGFVLKKDASRISLKKIYETIEGKLFDNFCLLDRKICRGKECILGDLVKKINKQMREYMDHTMICDLTSSYGKE